MSQARKKTDRAARRTAHSVPDRPVRRPPRTRPPVAGETPRSVAEPAARALESDSTPLVPTENSTAVPSADPAVPAGDPFASPIAPIAADRDILGWAQRFLPHYFNEPPAAFHAELLRDARCGRRRQIARVAPRGHAKSTCLALALPLWCVCERARRNIVIITHEASLATQFVRDIRQELETNEPLREHYGDLVHRAKWAEQKFTTSTGVSVQARGAGGSFRGVRIGPHRPDLIICDDIEEDEQVESPQGRRKLENWFRRVVMPALAPRGRMIVLGSLIHYDSLLSNLRDAKRYPGWDYRVYRAIEPHVNPDGSFELRPLWPARWPLARLEEERERIGVAAFEQEYQANPVEDTLRVFRPEWLRRWEPHELCEPRLATIMAVDPATGAAGGDYFAIWVGSVDRATGVIYTRELALERIGVVEQVRRILAAAAKWKPMKIGIETVAYQVALKDVLEEFGRREGLYLPLVPLVTTQNKRTRIEGSAPLYANGAFRLPPTLAPEVESQFLQYPRGRHDDAPDVCAMGIELARTLRVAANEIDVLSGSRSEWKLL